MLRAQMVRLHSFAMVNSQLFLGLVAVSIMLTVLAIRNPVLALSSACVFGLMQLITRYRILHARKSASTPQRGLAITLAVLVMVISMQPDVAGAAGLGGWARALKAQLGDVYDAFIYAAYGVGLVCAFIGVNNGIKKSKGDQQVTTASIFGYGLGGPVLMMLGYFADSAAESVGGGAGQMNRLPGGL